MTILSIIIPLYNSEETISRTLDSLKKISVRSKGEVELLIVDDGSTDSSSAVAEAKAIELTEVEVKVISQENRGLAGARNTGLREAKGRWVFFLDSDDELAVDPIDYIEKSPEVTALIFSVAFEKASKIVGMHRPTRIDLANHMDVFTAKNAITVSSMVFKRELIKNIFKEEYLRLEDWYFWITNPGIFENARVVEEGILTKVHIHGKNMTSNYVRMGLYRTMVAEKVLVDRAEGLTIKQRNNLLIQADIGRIRQGISPNKGAFLRFPCNLKLYANLIAHYVLRGNLSKLDVYG